MAFIAFVIVLIDFYYGWSFLDSVFDYSKEQLICGGKSYYGALLCCAWRLVLFGSSQLINEIGIYGSISFFPSSPYSRTYIK